MTAREFKIHGMDCVEEVTALKRELGPLVGEDQLSFDVLNGKLTVGAGAAAIETGQILQAVTRTGMGAQLWTDSLVPPGALPGKRGLSRPLLATLSGVFLVLGFVAHAALGGLTGALGNEGLGSGHALPFVVRLLYVLSIGTGIWYILPKAWFALRSARPDMNLLMTVAVIGALVIGEWFEAATVTFLFALSLLLESWSVGRARRAVEALLAATPDEVRVVGPDGREMVLPVDQVTVGTRFIVKPGERIPLDGNVVAGMSGVNQAPITGESLPVEKSPGAEVFAGSVNGEGALDIVSSKPATGTLLANIIRLVGEARSKASPSERWVERFARVYTPVVMGLALAVFLVPPLLGAGTWVEWSYRALVLLVIACPCALVISTPVSIVAALASGARNGVLFKGGEHVESPATLRAIAFDKTGTLTEGVPQVSKVVPLNDHTAQQLLAIGAALEARSTHPLALAIEREAARLGVSPVPAEGVQVLPGKGVLGMVDGVQHWIGSHRYLEERGAETPAMHKQLGELSSAGQSVVVIGAEDHVCGMIAVADTIRPEASATIRELRSLGVGHLVMLTGDNRETAQAIAQAVGIDEIRAELLPADKVDAITDLVERHHQVAMIGDGINDAPALARASLGIAMGAAGSDAAIEAADIALMANNIALLPWLILHSRRTLQIIKQNIMFSLMVKAIFVVLTAFGLATLWGAIFADMVTSLLVIANGLRLLNAPAVQSGETSCALPETA